MERPDLTRRRELLARAPLQPRTCWCREGDVCYLAGTLGAAFDTWQRALAATSAADGYLAQQIGLDEIERTMDALESEIRATLAPGETLLPRRSPGYGDWPLEMSRDILARLDAPRRIGLALTDSLLLAPSKSVTAICRIA